MALGEADQSGGLEQERSYLLDRDHVGVLGGGVEAAERSEQIAAAIFVQQDGLAVERVEQGMGPADDQEEGGGGAIALSDEVGFRRIDPDPPLAEDLRRSFTGAAQRRAQGLEIDTFGQINLR